MTNHPSKEKQEDWSRVYYSVQLRIPSWVPGIVIGYLNKKAIREVRFPRSTLPLHASAHFCGLSGMISAVDCMVMSSCMLHTMPRVYLGSSLYSSLIQL